MSTGAGGGWTRRQVLGVGGAGLAAVVAAGAGGLELVSRGVLPGQQALDQLDGACSVASPPMIFSASGPSVSGRFFSRARRRDVGYTVAYPPGYRPGSRLPLIIAANAGAYASAAAFTAADVVTHAAALDGVPVRVACGLRDPFRPGAQAFAQAARGAVVDISQGCHSGPFFTAQEPPSLAFLARHLTA